jgi:hypothetical protein
VLAGFKVELAVQGLQVGALEDIDAVLASLRGDIAPFDAAAKA